MSQFTPFGKLPAEIADLVWDDAFLSPGIEFFSLVPSSGGSPPTHTDREWLKIAPPSFGDQHIAGESYFQCLVPNGDYDYSTNMDLYAKSVYFKRRPIEDPSFSAWVRDLKKTCRGAKDRVAGCLRSLAHEHIIKEWHPYALFHLLGLERPIRRDIDLLCIQMPQYLYGRDAFAPCFEESDHSELQLIKKLAFEWRPWMFEALKGTRSRAVKVPKTVDECGNVITESKHVFVERQLTTYTRCYGELTHYVHKKLLKLETLYLIDYSFVLKNDRQPLASSEVFLGCRYKFVEVHPNDDAFEARIVQPSLQTSLQFASWLEESHRTCVAWDEHPDDTADEQEPEDCLDIWDVEDERYDSFWDGLKEEDASVRDGDGNVLKLEDVLPFVERFGDRKKIDARQSVLPPFKIKVLACIPIE